MASEKVTQIIDLISNMTVLELNELRKEMEEQFDVKAQAPVAMMAGPAAGGGAAEEEEPSQVSVLITDPGAKKLEVIKVVRTITGLGLKDAKSLVESGGKTPVKENVEKDEADKVKEQLEGAGAIVELK